MEYYLKKKKEKEKGSEAIIRLEENLHVYYWQKSFWKDYISYESN